MTIIDKRLVGATRLNLGSGTDPFPGWVNIDMCSFPGVDLVHDLTEALPLEDESVDAIFTAHTLEHISYRLASFAVADWMRVLRIGGRIQIMVPNLEYLVEQYVTSNVHYLQLVQQLYGGLSDACFDTHKNAIDFAWLQGQLGWFGCDVVLRLSHVDPTVLSVIATKSRHVDGIEKPTIALIKPKTVEELNERRANVKHDLNTAMGSSKETD